ncbi:YebC/PmpR family DNA-binding transcriptional regulator [Haploplasma axanthum]|uniref:Probable transcriptional regulatory protein NCTC10138_00099 n=1 Tax=Haploplasma axanthum TaxID=29552 RepID=A0A449BBC9_HAPAX|nr:YebC/PmpR family DNA-binding transcriptional regulator [Haploplasma axanthum]VEU79679.1 YebC/PmpR family DNA-binding regulatory protein [Haploplasma axanthum]
MGRAFEVRKQAMAKTAAAKTRVYSKYGREVYMAAKNGIDPDANLELKRIIEKAKKEQVPGDIIKRAIEKAKGGSEDNYSEVRYEGFGPGNTLFIVECLTDNVNRTISEVRNCFTKTGSKLGVSGSVVHMFNHQSVFAIKDVTEDEILEVVIENDIEVESIEADEDGVTVYGSVSDYSNIRTALLEAKKDIDFVTDEIMWVPTTEVKLAEQDDIDKFNRLTQMLDELDDVKDVYNNAIIED